MPRGIFVWPRGVPVRGDLAFPDSGTAFAGAASLARVSEFSTTPELSTKIHLFPADAGESVPEVVPK